MITPVAIAKYVSLRTRDFHAESWSGDNGKFHVYPSSLRHNEPLTKWWDTNRLEDHRRVFSSGDDSNDKLFCADEIEARALLIELQVEYNKVAL